MDETMNTMREIPARVLREAEPQRHPRLSYIEPHEEVIARALIDQQFKEITGKPFGFRPGGFYLACRIYIRPDELKKIKREDGTEATIYLPDQARTEDRYSSCSALVCAVGPQAYRGVYSDGSPRYPEGPWAKVGDWVAIPRQESFLVSYRGVALAVIPDDKVIGVIEDPTDVTPIQQAALV